ncbi:MAG TPA: ATP-binding protein [Kofleriaceae bacterium]|nr:ATP-binding protein [Kofleriaceae bacterium]
MTDSGDPDLIFIFPGSGELARRLRQLDWAATPLGPARQWPEPLRTAIRVCLASPSPMSVCWGPQLALICNEACTTLLGPAQPGRTAKESWPEPWLAIAPAIERALVMGEAACAEDVEVFLPRALPREEVYLRIACTPLLPSAEPGAVPAGVSTVYTETTASVLRARRLETVGRLGLETAKSRTLQTTCSAAMRVLGRNRPDVPFAAMYLADEHQSARLIATTGLPGEHPLPTMVGDAEPDRGPWQLDGALRKRRLVELDGLDSLAPPLTGHPWPEPVRHAVALPILMPRGAAAGLLVIGVSPRRVWDAAYRAFFEDIAGQIGASLGNAKAYQDERRRAEALAEIDRVKTAFFSNISHELRVPLTLLLGPVSSALAAAEPQLGGEDLDSVHRNAQQLLRRVNTLLDFVGIEEGRVRASYRPTDLATLTVDVATNFQAAFEKAGVELVVDCPPLPQPVHVDREMWEKIVLNLLSNALKFTFEGKITIALRAAEDGARLTVSDTGVGIAADVLPRIFERFRRVEEPRGRSPEGSGIGLALVQELVRLHDGRLDVHSATGFGTVFGVTLPFGERPSTLADPAASLDDEATPAAPTAMPFVSEAMQWLQTTPPTEAEGAIDRHIHIMVVDDNADMTSYLRRLLSKRWSVDCAPDGQAALEAIRQHRPSLVLTDMTMPNLDGFGLLNALRADPATARLPVIMLSARSGEHAEAALEAGADDYIVKPFSARELMARVAARLELDRLGTRLAQERAAVAEVFRQTPVPVCMLRGRALVYESANDAFVAALDLDVRGKSMFDISPHLARPFGVVLHDVMETGRPFVGREVSLLLPRYGRVEQTYWTLVFAQLPGGATNEKSVVCICNEVTEQVVGRKRLEELAERADAANRTKDEFLAILGHELRNPLSPIVTSLQLLRMREINSPEQDIIERQVHHLRRLVDDLLDVSRIARGKIELRRERVEVSEVLAAAIETSSPLFEQRMHRIDVDVPRTGLPVDVDPDRMSQVFSNLMTNAVKYSEPGTRIAIDARRVEDRVRVRVVDEGAGIAADMIDKVFDMFVQQAQTLERSRGGLGLGLSIVKSLVELHGGTVSARSEGVGHGTELTVELPAAAAEAARPQVVVDPIPLGGAAGRRILVVDDNDDAALSLKKALERLGYAVAIAHDGPAALRTAATFEPEIALLDIGLPVMDGYELARRLRELGRLHLVALSGYGQEADRRRSAEAGFEVHLTKPVDLRHLESVVRSLG